MVLEKEIPVFFEWIGPATLTWLVVVGILVVAALVLGLLFSIVRHGPVKGVVNVAGIFAIAVVDLFCMSPRRVSALAWLAVKEAIRRKVLVGMAVFIAVLMLAGWFLDPNSPEPGRLYLSFVMTTTSYLVLILALFLSVFSLPGDMKTKTLHTVVTKPVRPSEIVLGRVLGFTLVCTVLLVVMGALSYLFVVRGLSHQHTLAAADLAPIDADLAADSESVTLVGNTSKTNGHRHEVEVHTDASGAIRTRREHGHTHAVTVEGSGDTARYRIGPPEGVLVARVPRYGTLRFRDNQGNDKPKGINVGDEWSYRSFIQGGTPAAAIWTFQNVRSDDFRGERLPLELTLGVFRTHKGVITREVTGGLWVRNPDTGLSVRVEIFRSKEFISQKLWIPKKITKFSSAEVRQQLVQTPQGPQATPATIDVSLTKKPAYDLFTDLVTADGRMEVWVQCIEAGQHFGAAEPDLYLRADDASVPLNFVKGYFGIWLQVVIVTSFGVMFSTFLSGAVAMVATIGVLVAGFFADLMLSLSRSEVIGGGPAEAARRIVGQDNVMTDLPPGMGTEMVKLVDRVLQPGLGSIARMLPPLGDFSCANFVANGFNIPPDFILTRTVSALAFAVPLFMVGYLFLRNREVAR